jgi:hypothetical protein
MTPTPQLNFQLGDPVEHRGIVITPLFPTRDPLASYITLDEALPRGLQITETSEAGDVPELAVWNPLDESVLLYDGEELVGAKQNRILNTAILVAAGSIVKIPVSCTEQGRWQYQSKMFHASGHIMSPSLRNNNMMNVHYNLFTMNKYKSNQFEVWSDIATQAAQAKIRSSTVAMADIHKAKIAELDESLAKFELVPGQKGMLTFIDGKPSGMDFVSLGHAFGILFPKLVRSFALEALLRKARDHAYATTRSEEHTSELQSLS